MGKASFNFSGVKSSCCHLEPDVIFGVELAYQYSVASFVVIVVLCPKPGDQVFFCSAIDGAHACNYKMLSDHCV